MRLGYVCISLVASACMATSPSQQAGEPVRDRLQITVSSPKSQAIERVLATFVQESLTVASSSGGIITSEPLVVKSIGVAIANVTYTATVIGITDTTSQIVVAAYEQDLAHQGAVGHTDADARRKPISSNFRAMWIPYWQRVERIAHSVGNR